ncbi:MAG TPA: hypothetical protein DDW87_06425, partial [Firmicutes bacterium]|nr:hypothetical protein [Bacillota bacterium]
PEVPAPQVEQASPVLQEPEVVPQAEEPIPEVPEVPEVPNEDGRGEVLTSPQGPEVIVEPAA